MTLKDKLNDALTSTPPENTRRRDTLRAALNAGENDSDVAAALARLIEAREQKILALTSTGQTLLANAERGEVALLRRLLSPEFSAAQAAKGPAAKQWRGVPLTRTTALIGGAVLIVVAAGLLFLLRPSEETSGLEAAGAEKITAFMDDHTMGDPNAPITVLEYAAPMCPFCAKFATAALPGIKKDYIDTGKVFYIFRVYPLSALDGAVEGIARCLPRERYFGYMDRMFRGQSQWDPDGYQIADPPGAVAALSATEGLAPARIQQCMTDQAQLNRINEIAQDGEGRYGIDHTPFFVINGVVVNIPPGQDAGNVIRVRLDSLLALKQ
jgi:protein-disulfide isomerase